MGAESGSGMRRRDTPTGRIRGTTPEVEAAARELRWGLTPAEQALWQALRGRQLNGLKFRLRSCRMSTTPENGYA